MCGIAGFIDVEGSRDNAEQLIDSMCRVIRHRGPDDQGVWVGDGAALGMRRLSIIDLAGGHQPIFNEDESILVVFNGEIYNYRELQQELQARGHHFRTNSDTETIVHAYEEYGDDCVKHLRGMFVFALWDRKRQRLLAARDRFGKKPLNYYWDGQRLIFGSEIKSILEANIPREVNPIALDEYLAYRWVPTPHTLFKDVSKLPAAHILIYEDGQISTKRYWELSFTPTSQDDEATGIERTRALLKEAVQVRLMSEVPLGAFLSGGVDSSVVVGLMSSMMSQPVKTFSIGFEEDDYSELPYARQVARHFGTDHHEFFVRPELVSVLPQLVWAYDEPFADSSMLPTYYVSKLAREHVTVVLTGDGGDEIFGGYNSYQRELTISRIPGFMRFLLG
jgi:asparagine synthase (glutamine-hydrolysing)